ncbi:uncharacterized protein LOC100209113 [Hydra vulgaris]|uniref:uncharacterized protein LOC100209113 n=1 Tax=Hydra vulgaris TaxID=6087 RepID=UPI001F5FE5C8|nr:uncharacterized protein LOC100209113 [Hydra vulgaris]
MGNDISKVQIPSKLNLVEKAQLEYDFLRLVDKHPVLYCENVLRNAVYRYENYWLPLVVKYNELLPAPLDIEWVWHCHILNPIAYQCDCLKLFGKIIDHAPMSFTIDKISTSKRYWTQTYKDIPFEIDLTNSNPILISTKSFKCSYDIVAASMRQRVFNYNSSLPHFRDPKFLQNAVKRYKIMITIKKENSNTFIVPCYDNDLIWHSHMQHVLLYQSDMMHMLGSILDHDDSTSDRSPNSELSTSSAATKKLWKKYNQKFGVSGAMYRGEPPLPEFTVINQGHYLNLANKICQCSPLSIYIGRFPVADNATVKFHIGMVSLQGDSVILFSKTISLVNGELSYNFLEGEAHFQYSTEQSRSLEIYCEYPAILRKYTSRVMFPPLIVPEDPNLRSITIPLQCSLTTEMINCILTMRYSETLSNYSFEASSVNRLFIDSPHLKNVVHNLQLISPGSEYKNEAKCQYNDNILHTTYGLSAFKIRVVHSRDPILSVVEVIDLSENVLATSHTVGKFSLPSEKQVAKSQNVFTHEQSFERSMLIRGSKKDWGLLKSRWKGFTKAKKNRRGQRGEMELKLFTLNGKNSRYEIVNKVNDVKFEWATEQGRGSVDLLSGYIRFSGSVSDVPEFLCVAYSIAILFVLCQPRPPPPKTGGVYLPPSQPGRLNLDAMPLLVIGGLYATTLPKWYHVGTLGGYFIQVPKVFKRKNDDNDYDGGDCGDSGDNDYDGGADNCENEIDCEKIGFDSCDTYWIENNSGCGSGGGCGSSCGGAGGGDNICENNSGGGCGSSCGGGGGCGSNSGGGGGCGSSCGSGGGE